MYTSKLAENCLNIRAAYSLQCMRSCLCTPQYMHSYVYIHPNNACIAAYVHPNNTCIAAYVHPNACIAAYVHPTGT